ncbi:MAG: PIN-like domain-containing protein [Wujia sp.]
MDLYKKYYLEENDILDIINEGIVVFDTSALLDIYYYSDESQEQIFNNALSGMKGRLWIPAQCYFEFLKNKENVVGKPRRSYEALLDGSNSDKGYVPRIVPKVKEFGKAEISELKGLLKTLKETTTKKEKHPYLDQDLFVTLEKSISELEEHVSAFSEAADQFEVKIRKEIEKKIEELKIETDDVLQFIEYNFEVGQELSFERMLDICEEGRKRYIEKIPPGYEDEKKSGMQKYGDLFAWKEILQMAKDRKKDVILVTNDVKADWWDKEQKAPCFELLKEFHSTTGKRFWSCSMKDFLYKLNERNDSANKISEEIIEEVDDVTRQMFEDSLKLEIDRLFTGVLQNWLDSESEFILGERQSIMSEWSVSGNCYLYNAINYRGDEALVLMNIVEKANYANVYHAFNNLLEIKRYFDRLGKEFKYRQVVVARSRNIAEQISYQLHSIDKLAKVFKNSDIENDLVYLDDGILIYMNSNHPMG